MFIIEASLGTFFLVSAIIVALTAGPTAIGGAMAEGSMPKAEGKAVYNYITQTNPYAQWPLWPGTERLYPGTEPHGALLTTHVNDVAQGAIKGKKETMPDGAIIVKENYTPDRKLAAVTVMYKKAGYSPHHGDWFWLKYAPDGRIEAQGMVDTCMACHAKAIHHDWLFTVGKARM